MKESKRSPVLFPFVLVHLGVLGIVSSFFVAIQRDLLVRGIGIAGLASSVFPIIAGLIAIGQYRRQPVFFEDANYALKALSIFVLPALTYILSIAIIFVIYSFSGNVIIFVVLIIQYFIQRSVNFSTTNYCRFFKCREPIVLKWILLTIITVVNLGSIYILVKAIQNIWGSI